MSSDPNTITDGASATAFHARRWPEYLAYARSVARRLGRDGAFVTTDMVRAIAPPPPEAHPSVCGAIMERGVWERIGFTHSSRPEGRNRVLGVYRLRVGGT